MATWSFKKYQEHLPWRGYGVLQAAGQPEAGYGGLAERIAIIQYVFHFT